MISIRQSVTRSIIRSSSILERRALASAPVAIRFNSTVAQQESSSSPIDPKITSIVEQISKLTLLETSSLINELKTTLNIPDISFPTGGAGGVGAGGAAPAAPVEEVVEEVVEEKTIFNLKLESFDAKAKPKIIKEVKSLLGLSLVESKKFVESAPKVLKENVTKEDGEKIKSTLEALGAKITLE